MYSINKVYKNDNNFIPIYAEIKSKKEILELLEILKQNYN